MIPAFTSTSLSRILRMSVLGSALLLVACGGGGNEPTQTPIPPTVVAQPTQPPIVLTATPESTEPATEIAISTSTAESTLVSTDVPAVATPAVAPVDLTGEDSTPVPVGSPVSPVSDVVWVIGNTPGDGTGGSGAPGERDAGDEDEVDATPEVGATPVAQLSIEGCELPHVPTFIGDSDQVVLTADVNFRSGPDVDCDPLLDEPLGEGQTVTVTGGPVTQATDDSEWVEVEVNGERGWINAEFIEFVP